MRKITIQEAEELKEKLKSHLEYLTCHNIASCEVPINDFAHTCSYMLFEISHDINQLLMGHNYGDKS